MPPTPLDLARRAGVAAATGFSHLARAVWPEARRLLVRRRSLTIPHWPRGLDGLTVAVVSDLHAGGPDMDEHRVERVAEVANRMGSELAVVLGDVLDVGLVSRDPVEPAAAAAALGNLSAPLGVFAVLGNHDWGAAGRELASAMGTAGIEVLENDAAVIERGGARLWVAGFADEQERTPDVPGTLAPIPDEDPVLALSHSPDLFPDIPARVSLTLAGHTHGGQINVPLLRRLTIPSRHGVRYRRGHIVEGGRHLFVHPGIGTTGIPVRFRSAPEVTQLVLRSA